MTEVIDAVDNIDVVAEEEETIAEEGKVEEPTETPTEDEPEEPTDSEDTDPTDDEDTDVDSDDEDTPESSYEEYTDPALKQVVTILQDAEIPVEATNKIFQEAIDQKDFSKVDKAALTELLGDKADIVYVLAESFYNKQFAAFEKTQSEAFELTGGEEGFNAMRTWAASKAEVDADFKADLAELRSMIDSGSKRAFKAAISELYGMYKADPDTTIKADVLTGDKPGSSTSIQPLSQSEYGELLLKAERDGTYNKVHKQLWARRQAGIKQGK